MDRLENQISLCRMPTLECRHPTDYCVAGQRSLHACKSFASVLNLYCRVPRFVFFYFFEYLMFHKLCCLVRDLRRVQVPTDDCGLFIERS